MLLCSNVHSQSSSLTDSSKTAWRNEVSRPDGCILWMLHDTFTSLRTGHTLLQCIAHCTDQFRSLCGAFFDILLRVHAEESRAVGVSGLQSNHRTTTPFGARVVPQRRCGGLLAVPSRRYPYPRPCRASQCCFCHGDASRRQQSRGYRLVRFEQSARRHTLRGCGVHRLFFRILSRYVSGQAASAGRFGIRSVPTDSYRSVRWPVT